MLLQNIPLKGRTDFRCFRLQRLFAFELRRWERSSSLVPGSRQDACADRNCRVFCRCRDDPAAANPAIPLLTLRWTFPARRASVGSICSAERAAMRARVIFISKHRCRLGGDCANLFVLSSRRSQGGLEPIFGSTVHWRKVGDATNFQSPNCLNSL